MKRHRIIPVGKVLIGILVTCFVSLSIPSTVYAIDLPDEDPEIIDVRAYQNVLETDDMLVILYENTPYATTPNMTYSESFTWKFYDVDGTTELGYALLSDYHEFGYGYSIVSFYFDAADNITWQQPYYIKLKGLAAAFAAPPRYTFQMTVGDYTNIDATAVKLAIGDRIITLARYLNNNWDLDETTLLTFESEIGTKLSVEGQAFFRQAIYGVQAMAPSIFPMYFSEVTNEDRTWTDEYVSLLDAQFTGTDMADAISAGESFTNTSYNLMGLMIILILVIMLIFGHWYLGSTNRWTGLLESAPVLVIGGRMAMLGLGELGLVVALCWLYFTGRLWKVF